MHINIRPRNESYETDTSQSMAMAAQLESQQNYIVLDEMFDQTAQAMDVAEILNDTAVSVQQIPDSEMTDAQTKLILGTSEALVRNYLGDTRHLKLTKSVKSFESMRPTSNKQWVLEGIGDLTKSIWDAIVKFFTSLADWFKNLFSSSKSAAEAGKAEAAKIESEVAQIKPMSDETKRRIAEAKSDESEHFGWFLKDGHPQIKLGKHATWLYIGMDTPTGQDYIQFLKTPISDVFRTMQALDDRTGQLVKAFVQEQLVEEEMTPEKRYERDEILAKEPVSAYFESKGSYPAVVAVIAALQKFGSLTGGSIMGFEGPLLSFGPKFLAMLKGEKGKDPFGIKIELEDHDVSKFTSLGMFTPYELQKLTTNCRQIYEDIHRFDFAKIENDLKRMTEEIRKNFKTIVRDKVEGAKTMANTHGQEKKYSREYLRNILMFIHQVTKVHQFYSGTILNGLRSVLWLCKQHVVVSHRVAEAGA